jgi:hypothetical protein
LEDGTNVKYNDVTWKRKDLKKYVGFSFLFGLSMVKIFQFSKFWYAGCFVPVTLLYILDRKSVPYSEFENFYKFVYEKRKANVIYNKNHEQFENEVTDKETYEKLKKILINTNKTIYEVNQEINEAYLNAAISQYKAENGKK